VKGKFLEALEAADLFRRHAVEQSEADKLAMARILKITFDNLGFAWIDDKDSVTLTPAGKTFVEATDAKIFTRQLWRYQITNPLWGGSDEVRLFPHAFLVEVMLESGRVLSRDEFILFVARARTHDELEYVLEHIAAWRDLDSETQSRIKEELDEIPLDEADEDMTMLNRVALNSSYCLAFHGLPRYMRRNAKVNEEEYALSIGRHDERYLTQRLERFHEESVFIEYESKKDWMAAYGDLESNSTRSEALEYYADRSNVDKAVKAFMMLPAEAREGFTEEEYRRIQIQEKNLEDMLEGNITLLGDTLMLVKDGRQYETLVGPIDLLASEKGGGYVVIELKKGRTADKVFGQLCRYMGFIKREVANGAPVRGIIVGKEIDQKLLYAVEAVPEGLVTLKAFDFRLAIQDRGLGKKD
jgi:RecB family endonuclease NucS